VRGDSLRDLYAKALALLGLGLLGAAGALVDYWPVRSALPAVASALVLPADFGIPALGATALPATSSGTEFGAPATKSPAHAVADVDLVIPDAAGAAGAAGNDAVFGLSDSQTESLEPAAVLPPSLAVAPASMAAMPVSTLALLPPVITAFEATTENPLSPEPVPPTQSRDNRFTSAAKTSARAVVWTGSAIARPIVALGHFLHL
jgi:hypothetical protein